MNIKIQKTYFLLLFTCLTIACSQAPKDIFKTDASTDQKYFFDIAYFVATQIELLDELKPKLIKRLDINGTKEFQNTRKINWKKELGLFSQLDINKPAWKNSYKMSKKQTNQYEEIAYTAQEKNLPVAKIKIQIDKNLKNSIVSLEAKLVKDNTFYNSEKTMQFKCEKLAGGKYILTQYNISGSQQISFYNKEYYKIEGKLIH